MFDPATPAAEWDINLSIKQLSRQNFILIQRKRLDYKISSAKAPIGCGKVLPVMSRKHPLNEAQWVERRHSHGTCTHFGKSKYTFHHLPVVLWKLQTPKNQSFVFLLAVLADWMMTTGPDVINICPTQLILFLDWWLLFIRLKVGAD